MKPWAKNWKGHRCKFILIGDLSRIEREEYTHKSFRQEQDRRDKEDLEAGLLVREQEWQDIINILNPRVDG